MNFLFLASFGQVASYVGYVLLAVLLLLVMITVHELGHYLTGKMLGFGIDEFAVGFGPKIFSKKKKDGEVFSIRALPLGGFCAFSGEDEDSKDPKAFNNRKPWQRLIVLVSGALMNYLFALLIICVMFGAYGKNALVTYKVNDLPLGYDSQNSFISRDVILKANGKNVYITSDLMSAIEGKEAGETVDFKIMRQGKVMDLTVKLREHTNFKNLEDITLLYDALGVYYQTDETNGEMIDGGLYATGVKLGFFRTIGASVEYSIKLAGTVFIVLGQLLTGKLGLSSMGGTVTTIAVTAQAISFGFRNLLNIGAFIGVNLAVFNLLPIPALDGSRVIFTLIEWVRGKPISRKVEGIIHTVGLVLLVLFAVFIDLQRCF
ncbi:MAG: site-2 protease family protein [Clostridia bacterium]|nr:site-2 protease family protein [Clostridia bacterium]